MACTTSSAACVARTLSCIADVLGEMASDKVGLRSGPAANESWMHAYRLLEVRDAPLKLYLKDSSAYDKYKHDHMNKHVI